MRKSVLVAAAALAAVVLFAGCTTAAKDVMPLTVGNKWTDATYTLFGTTTASLDTTSTSTMVSEITGTDHLTSGEEVFVDSFTMTTHQRIPDTTYIVGGKEYLRQSGNYYLRYQTLSGAPDTFLASDLSVGKTWHEGSETLSVVAQENVDVRAGSYTNAYKVKWTGNAGGVSYDIYAWYAKGTGEVKEHFEFAPMSGYYEIYNAELTAVTIK